MAAKVKKCRRCGRRLRNTSYLDSMAWLRDGTIDHLVCSRCQTATEHAAMAVRESTMEAGITPDGSIMVRPKIRRSDQQETQALSGDACH